MTIVVNGDVAEVPAGLTVGELLTRLSVQGTRVAVEVNLAVVRRDRHPDHVLSEGDRVEIVRFVGGG